MSPTSEVEAFSAEGVLLVPGVLEALAEITRA